VIGRAFDAVLFDLDDTLHDDTAAYRTAAGRVADEIAASRGIPAEPLVDAYIDQAESFWSNLGSEHLASSMGGLRVRMWTAGLAAVGVDDRELGEWAAEAYNRYRADALEPYPEALPLLAALRAAGRKTALITNGFAETHRDKIAQLRLDSAFDAILIADEIGMIKPDPRVFLHACELLGVAPGASVMVGDRYERDIIGALEAGLATIWLNPAGVPIPGGAPPPDAIVGSFADVTAALAATLSRGRGGGKGG
jgi:putative hydrolase of the HAD superfamily